MSESGDNGLVAAIEAGQTAPAAPDPAAAPIDYEAKYNHEVADRIRERNLYKRPAQVFKDLDDGTVQALTELADAVRSGDQDAIIEWNLQTAASVSGKDVAALIAERQARERATQQPAAPTPGQGMDPAEVQRIVQEQVERQMRLNEGQRQVLSDLKERGYEFGSPEGDVIVRYAVQNKIEIPEAVTWFEGRLTEFAQKRAGAAAATTAATPGVVPGGVAPSTQAPANQTDRDRAMARLQREATAPG